MSITKDELAALKHRVSQAYHSGYRIANPEDYVAKLGGGKAPEGVVSFSAEHVLYLIEEYEAKAAAPTAPVIVEAAPVIEPVIATHEPIVEAAPAVEVTPVVEEAVVVAEAVVEAVVEEAVAVEATSSKKSKKKA